MTVQSPARRRSPSSLPSLAFLPFAPVPCKTPAFPRLHTSSPSPRACSPVPLPQPPRVRPGANTSDPPPWPSVRPVLFRASKPSEIFADRLVPSSRYWRVLLFTDGQIMLHLRHFVPHASLRLVDVADPPQHDPLLLEKIPLLGSHRLIRHPVSKLIEDMPWPRKRRQIQLLDQSGRVLLHATTWWDAHAYQDIMASNEQLPLFDIFEQRRILVSRKVHGLHYGPCPELEPVFRRRGPFWAKFYLFKAKKLPMVAFYEVFSPTLARFVGPMPRPASVPHSGYKLK